MGEETAAPARPASRTDLFWTFTWLALQGFGGVLAVAQRVLCEQRRWLTREQFVEILAVGQVLPGPNICNVALMIGDRFFGWRGAFAALAGMMAIPAILVLAITILYATFAAHPVVAGALKGMGAVSAGLIVATALKLMVALRSNPMGTPVCLGLGLGMFGAVALLRWPLAWMLLGAGLVACLYAWFRLGADAAGDAT
ncbi:MAG TPA: chromate transporter [Burkholderiales bacterium]|jgi:chromate transporter|nr:chromate transporter [Burkholderiales bacterium]